MSAEKKVQKFFGIALLDEIPRSVALKEFHLQNKQLSFPSPRPSITTLEPMPSFPYSAFQIEEVVKAPKHPRNWDQVEFKRVGDKGGSRHVDVYLEREDGRADRIRLVVNIGSVAIPTSYKAALLLESVRIRGVDHHAVSRTRFYKEVIPKGWHEDVIDPNFDLSDYKNFHRREALPNFEPVDAADFLQKVAALWNIQLPQKNSYLL